MSGERRWSVKGALLLLFSLLACGALAVWLFGFGRGAPRAPQNAVEATARPSIAVSTTSLYFGVLPAHGSVLRKVVLRNDGSLPVKASLAVSDPDSYSVAERELELEPGASSVVSVRANPARPGMFRDELRITVGGSEAEPVVIALHGRVAPSTGDESVAAAREAVSSGLARKADAAREARGDVVARSMPRSRAGGASEPPRAGGASKSGPSRTAGPGTGSASAGGAEDDRDYVVPVSPSQRPGAVMRPYDPATSTPIVGMVETVRPVITNEISAEELAGAQPSPEQAPLGDDPEDIPEDLLEENPLDDDDSKPDPFDDEKDDDPDPFTRPTLTISGTSTVTLLGSSVTFYPQQIDVLGGDGGGPLELLGGISFPAVGFAFGESMVFNPTGSITGTFDSQTRQLSLNVPIAAVDSDGDAAPIMLHLTTGMAAGKNDSGIVVSLSGSPRDPASGVLKLVGIQPIPVGHRNGAENHLMFVEVPGRLTFGTSAMGGS